MYSNLRNFGNFVNMPTIGFMYHFAYDAKGKLTLPYWDLYPLIIMTDFQDGNRILGLNLHYVPQVVRAQILNQLIHVTPGAHKPPDGALKARYYYLKQLGMLDLIKPCIHSYLLDHFQSRFLEIDPHYWFKVMKIPSAVWSKSKPYRGAK